MIHAQHSSAGVYDPTGLIAEGGDFRAAKVTLVSGQVYEVGHPVKANAGNYEEVADETEIKAFVMHRVDATAANTEAIAIFQGPINKAALPVVSGVTYDDAVAALAETGLFLR